MLLTLPDDVLDPILADALVERRCGPDEADPVGTPVPRFDDTVFLALVCRRVCALVRARFAELVGEALRTQLYKPPSWSAKDGRPRLVTSIGGLFVSKSRFLYAYRHIFQLPPDRLPLGAVVHAPAWAPLALVYQNKWDVDMDELRRYPSAVRCHNRVAEIAGFAAPLLTKNALVALVRHAPIAMIRAAFARVFGAPDAPGSEAWSASQSSHRVLLMTAARYGRLDVLDALVHTQPQLQRSYDSKRGILDMVCSDTNVRRGRSRSGPVFLYIVLPAVLGDRPDVLVWLRELNDDLARRGVWLALHTAAARAGRHPGDGETGPWCWDESPNATNAVHNDWAANLLSREVFGSTWYRSRDFSSAAVLAVRCGAVGVLDWLYAGVREDAHETWREWRRRPDVFVGSDGRAHEDVLLARFRVHLCTYRLALLAVAFCGTLVPPLDGTRTHSSGSHRRGASARWAQRKWKEEVDTDAPNIFAARTPDLFGFLGAFAGLAHQRSSRPAPMNWERTAHGGWGSLRSLPALVASTCQSGLGIVNAIVCTIGDEDRTRWLVEESQPGGFVDRVLTTERALLITATMPWIDELAPAAALSVVPALWLPDVLAPGSTPSVVQDPRARWLDMFARAVPNRSSSMRAAMGRWELGAPQQFYEAATVPGALVSTDEAMLLFGTDPIDRWPSCLDWLCYAIPQHVATTDVSRREPTSVERGFGVVVAEHVRCVLERAIASKLWESAHADAPAHHRTTECAQLCSTLQHVRTLVCNSIPRMWSGPVQRAARELEPQIEALCAARRAFNGPDQDIGRFLAGLIKDCRYGGAEEPAAR